MRRTFHNCKVLYVANFRVREARHVGFGAREAWKIVVRLVFRVIVNLSVSPLATTCCKILRRITFCVRLSHSLVISLSRVPIGLDCIGTLYLCVLCLFSTFCKVVRSFANEHEVMPCLQ